VKGSFYTLGYAACLGAVCALLLTAAASFTQPYKDANAKAEEVLNILEVLKVPFQDGASSEQLLEIFDTNVQEQKQNGRVVYVYSSPQAAGRPEAVVIPFSGPGLWGRIKGFLAMEPDMRTIRGVTFYEHEETPGLGGEIASSWFRKQFEGKSIVDETGKAGIIIQRAKREAARNEVDAITGATMTCSKVEAMLNAVIRDIVKE
jgi:Na+-transporting NADH:ubiquinone oxidoreductase subunit C